MIKKVALLLITFIVSNNIFAQEIKEKFNIKISHTAIYRWQKNKKLQEILKNESLINDKEKINQPSYPNGT